MMTLGQDETVRLDPTAAQWEAGSLSQEILRCAVLDMLVTDGPEKVSAVGIGLAGAGVVDVRDLYSTSGPALDVIGWAMPNRRARRALGLLMLEVSA